MVKSPIRQCEREITFIDQYNKPWIAREAAIMTGASLVLAAKNAPYDDDVTKNDQTYARRVIEAAASLKDGQLRGAKRKGLDTGRIHDVIEIMRGVVDAKASYLGTTEHLFYLGIMHDTQVRGPWDGGDSPPMPAFENTPENRESCFNMWGGGYVSVLFDADPVMNEQGQRAGHVEPWATVNTCMEHFKDCISNLGFEQGRYYHTEELLNQINYYMNRADIRRDNTHTIDLDADMFQFVMKRVVTVSVPLRIRVVNSKTGEVHEFGNDDKKTAVASTPQLAVRDPPAPNRRNHLV